MPDLPQLAPLAVVVMLVDLLESTSIARALAAKGKYELSANQVCAGSLLVGVCVYLSLLPLFDQSLKVAFLCRS